MQIEIRPSKARGVMAAPPSKSAAHRLLLCAGLARGDSIVRRVADSQDMLATMDCLKALGAGVTRAGEDVHITGVDPARTAPAVLPCRECGTTLRFFVPIALLSGQEITLTGSEKLMSRPMSVYEKLCADRGFRYEPSRDSLTVCGRLTPGEYTVPGNISSQFISGLAFALTQLEGDSVIRILPPVESRPYIDMTLDAFSAFGVTAAFSDGETIRIPGLQRFRPSDVTVEGDYSNAAFFDALTLLGGDVTVTGLKEDSLQGDRVYRRYFESMKNGTPTVDLSDCPDLGPVCMASAAALHGAVFTGTRRLRIKESDRCAAMAEELAKFGIETEVTEDTMTVKASGLRAPDMVISGHNDHRIVMAMAVLATLTGGRINGAQAVSKSLPDFFDRLKTLGIEVTEYGMGL